MTILIFIFRFKKNKDDYIYKYRILFKNILTFLGLEYSDVLVKIMYLVVLGIIVLKIK